MNNIPKYFSYKLRPKEDVIILVRPFVFAYFWWFLLSFVLFFSALYFMFFLFDFGLLGKIIFFAILFLGLFSLIKTLVIWSFSGMLITKERIIYFDQYGFFSKQITEAEFLNIQDISMKQKGFWQTILHFGDIKIQTAGSENFLEIKYITNVHRVYNLLTSVYSAQKQKNIGLSKDYRNIDDLRQILIKKKQEIGAEKFVEIFGDLLKK